ncbi:MAG: GNAT family N-acetyltransferase [Pseudomonadota bacterium]
MNAATAPPYQARVLARAADLDGALWDGLAGTANPFLRHGFFTALEDAGCATAQTGWQPFHILLENAAGSPLGLMPAYLKSHSYGEYVFDHGWADAYERAGGRYYPKLQACVPFTPVPGPRLLAHDDAARQGLIEAAQNICKDLGLSGLHITFATPQEAAFTQKIGLHTRLGIQFHWRNRGYRDFSDFLAALASRKRKAIRRERAMALADGLSVEILMGREIREAHWDAFFAFYRDTGGRKWGVPYLNRAFFSLLGERLGDGVVLMLALRDGQPIAGALNLRGRDALHGRYWGAKEARPFLHFELCYYQAIDFAIAHGLRRVEAGAQGPHKIPRGYEPVATCSAHWLRDPMLHNAVADFLEAERQAVKADIAALAAATPFKKSPI